MLYINIIIIIIDKYFSETNQNEADEQVTSTHPQLPGNFYDNSY